MNEWTKYTPSQKQLFDSLEPGDIIVAWMPLSPEKMSQIDENHQKRPYIVVAKKREYIRCYPCTTKAKNTDPTSRYELGTLKYKMWKSGYVQIQSPINLHINCLVNKIDRLQDDDIASINRIASRRSIKEIDRKFSFNVETGDIVRDNNKLYYVNIENNSPTYYPLNKQGRKGSFMLRTYTGNVYPEATPVKLYGVIDKSCVVCHSHANVKKCMDRFLSQDYAR